MTAVEWLANEISTKHDKSFLEFYKAEVEQAKEIEKEQIIDALFFGIHLENNNIDSPLKRAEQYYNETFSNKSE